MTRIQNLAYRTELWFHAFSGIVTQRGGYLKVETPSSPTYYWGNCLLFPGPPCSQDYRRWIELFRAEFPDPSESAHITLGWDGIDGECGEVRPFLAAGFALEESHVLCARARPSALRPPRPPRVPIEVREVRTEREWAEASALSLQVGNEDGQHDPVRYAPFHARYMEARRRMAEAGLGGWWAAYEGGVQVGGLGLYLAEGMGRFQSVAVRADRRRLGVCRAMLYEVARRAFAAGQAETLVLVADEHAAATRIYQGLGFEVVQRARGLCHPTGRCPPPLL